MSTVTPGCWVLRSVVLMGLMLASWPGSGWAGLAPAAPAGVAERYGKLPLSFEANQGQTDARVKFLARGPGYAVFLTADEAVLTLRPPENPPPSINPIFNPRPPGEGRVRGTQQDFFLEDIFARAVRATADLQSRVAPPHPNPLPLGEGAKVLDRLLRGEAGNMADTPGAVVRMRLEGARTAVPVSGRERLPGTVNYLKGRDPAGWRTGVATYGRVEYRGVYPGIDLVYYGHHRSLEYDFIVAPGADPNQIRLSFAGEDPAAAPRLEANGDLLLPAGAGTVRLRKPVVYQELDGQRRTVEGRFVMRSPAASAVQAASPAWVSFQVGDYDPTRPLVIDPVLAYSTYLGGSSLDFGNGIAVDGAGNAYVTGYTESIDFPTVNAKYPQWRGYDDAFVFKLSADGQSVRYSTYLGGGSSDSGTGIAVDGAGNAYVTGLTYSDDFPTVNAKYPNYGGGEDAFVFKLSTDGQSVRYSTYLGGSGIEESNGIAVDGAGNAHVTGWTTSNDFPTINAKYPEYRGGWDAFVFKLSADGQTVRYSTYLGGSYYDWGNGIAVDGAGNAYVTGHTGSNDFPMVNARYPKLWGYSGDAFVFKLSADGQTVRYSTYLGGSYHDWGNGIAVDGAGNAYVTGQTDSNDFPTVNARYPKLWGYSDAFVFKLSADGLTVRYSTYLGGSSDDLGNGIAVDGAGNAYVTGVTWSNDFPTVNAKYPQLRGVHDAFVFKLSADGQTVRYSTYLGGSGSQQACGIAVDGAGNAYVTGETPSSDFPTAATDPNIVSYDPTYNGGGDAFIAKFSTSDLILTPTTQDFGIVPPNQAADRTYTLQNLGEKTLTGTVAAPAPYRVTAGASFTLATGAQQDVTVRYAPLRVGIHHRSLGIAGNFPKLTAALNGISGPVAKRPPSIVQTLLKGVPGDSLSLTGRYFGPLPGQLAIDGNATPTQTWSDGYLRFTLPTLTPGGHSLTVTTAYGQAQTRLQILGGQPIISAIRPGNGTPGSTVVLDGYNFGAQQGSATLTVGGQNAPINTWSDPRITFKIPALKTGTSYPLRLTTPTGSAEKTLLVRDLFLLTEYGDCDPGTWLFAYDICPPIILTVKNPREGGAKLDIQVENLVDRWYELTITPVGATVPAGSLAIIGPKQKFTLTGVTVSPGARIQFFADATSTQGWWLVAFDLIHLAATGSHVSLDQADVALNQMSEIAANQPGTALVVFMGHLVNNLVKGDVYAIVTQIRDLPKVAADPATLYFLRNYLVLSKEQIAKLGSAGAWVRVGGIVVKMLEQLALPRYAASALTAQ